MHRAPGQKQTGQGSAVAAVAAAATVVELLPLLLPLLLLLLLHGSCFKRSFRSTPSPPLVLHNCTFTARCWKLEEDVEAKAAELERVGASLEAAAAEQQQQQQAAQDQAEARVAEKQAELEQLQLQAQEAREKASLFETELNEAAENLRSLEEANQQLKQQVEESAAAVAVRHPCVLVDKHALASLPRPFPELN